MNSIGQSLPRCKALRLLPSASSLLFSASFFPGLILIPLLTAAAQLLAAPDSVHNFPLPISPRGVTSDGTNIWVTTLSSSNVTKLTSDGTVLGAFPAGGSTIYGTFDGANIWVTNVL